MPLDNVTGAAELIRLTTKFAGPNSETLKWVKEELKAGSSPKDIADALAAHLRSLKKPTGEEG